MYGILNFFLVPCQEQIQLYGFPGFLYGSGSSRITPFLLGVMEVGVLRLVMRGISILGGWG